MTETDGFCFKNHRLLSLTLNLSGMLISTLLFCCGLLGIGARKNVLPTIEIQSLFAMFCIVSLLISLLKIGCDLLVLCDVTKVSPESYLFWYYVFYNIWLGVSFIWCFKLPEDVAIIYGVIIIACCVFFMGSLLGFYKTDNHRCRSESLTNVLGPDTENPI